MLGNCIGVFIYSYRIEILYYKPANLSENVPSPYSLVRASFNPIGL